MHKLIQDPLNCPEGAYTGLDNQGNVVCRDIASNQIINSKTELVTDSGRGTITDSGRTITNSDKAEIIPNDGQTDYTIIGILGFIGIIGAILSVYGKKLVPAIPQIRSWNQIQKEEVRSRQYNMCNICYKKPTKWAYDHIDGDKKNNDISNCQGLCSQCKSEKTIIIQPR